MTPPILAADVLAEADDEFYAAGGDPEHPPFLVDALRRACGWDGEGDPPEVVIRSDGTLATANFYTSWRIGSPDADPIMTFTLNPVTEDGDDDVV